MSKTLLALGPVVFRDFELPPSVSFGGKQQLVVHRLADGRKVIDSLGRDDSDISFSGVFAGSDATIRARALDELRVNGVPVPLTWDVFFYSVLVREFAAVYRNDTWIPYTLTCAVLRDEASSLIQATASVAEGMLADIAAAAEGGAGFGLDFNAASTAISRPGATTYGTLGFQAAQGGLASANAAIDVRIADSERQLEGLKLSDGSPEVALSNLSSAASTAQQLAWASRAKAYVGRAMVNLMGQGG